MWIIFHFILASSSNLYSSFVTLQYVLIMAAAPVRDVYGRYVLRHAALLLGPLVLYILTLE